MTCKGIGDVDQSLANYYSDRVAAVAGATGVPERKIRDWFGRQLTTGQEFCPFCIYEIQVGFSHTDPLSCIYLRIPEKRGTEDSGEIAVTLPEKPGTYFLAFDRTLDYTRPVQWGSALPDLKKDRYFLKVDVEAIKP